MLSFNRAEHKCCIQCYEDDQKHIPASWELDVHNHDPYGDGSKPFDRFTQNYHSRESKMQNDHDAPDDDHSDDFDDDDMWAPCRAPELDEDVILRLRSAYKILDMNLSKMSRHFRR